MGMIQVGSRLDEISRVARPYPAHLLSGCETGLVLFSAAFLGHNDAIHFVRNDVLTTCVDTDGSRLAEMSRIYPEGWGFVMADAWEFAGEQAAAGSTWDAVSVDTFTGEAMERSLDSLDLWCGLARRVVTVTMPSRMEPFAPEGWRGTFHPRSSDVSWLVLTRA
jgi:hypothetical protein